MTGAGHRELYCFEPQTMDGVPTGPFLDEDIHSLENLMGHGNPLTNSGFGRSGRDDKG